MSNCSACTDSGTSRENYERERWNAHQKILADSINDTARMARASLTLVMLAALYLFLTLLASSDEQLLRESDVVVPQINIGISITTNYVIAPLIFLYLHAQTLFLLSILARKIQRFIWTSNNGPTVPASSSIRQLGGTEEHWNWLSAFVFVQQFRPIGDHPRLSLVRLWLSRKLFGISIVAIPVVLLFLIDLSFVRYQSVYITNIHHSILILDIISTTWFIIYTEWLRREETLQTLEANRMFWIKAAIATIGVCMLLLYAQPPQFGGSGTTNERVDVWKKSKGEKLSPEKRPFDFILCGFLNISYCRYIDVNGELLANLGIELPDDTGTKKAHAEPLDLAERELRYACFRSAKLHHLDLRSADLRGADFGSAKIYNSNLSKAKLHDANFIDAELNGIDISLAKLRSANLSGAELRDADIRGAELYYTNLSDMKGPNTKGCVPHEGYKLRSKDKITEENKGNTKLHGADLRFAKLHGADLKNADLHGADLRYAELHGADLEGAKLHGANLSYAKLYGANLKNVELDGADLGNAKFAGSSGAPKSWKFVWMSDTTTFFPFYDPDSPKDHVGKDSFIRISLEKDSFIKKSVDIFRKRIEMEDIKDDWKEKSVMKYAKLLEDKIKENSWRDSYMMPDSQDMIHLVCNWCDDFPWRILDQSIEPFRKLSADDDKGYWKARSGWVADFACRDEYNARIVLKRWNSETPLSNIKPKNHCMAISTIVRALNERKEGKKEECFGLHTLPNDEWLEFLSSTRNRMEQLKEELIHGQCGGIPKTDRRVGR